MGIIVAVFASDFLGGYLVFSAVCLALYEKSLYELQIDKLLDTIDGFCDAEANSKHLGLITGDADSEATALLLSVADTAGIPTGLAPDIEAQIQKRRNRKPPPDDLA